MTAHGEVRGRWTEKVAAVQLTLAESSWGVPVANFYAVAERFCAGCGRFVECRGELGVMRPAGHGSCPECGAIFEGGRGGPVF